MSKQPGFIAPSILSANFAALGEDVRKVLDAGADLIHVDIMDNHYVPNLTFGPIICKALRDHGITAAFDVHLMIQPVDSILPALAEAKVDYITFHPDASIHVHRTLQLIKSYGIRAGIALNPASPVECLKYLITEVDMILIMSVNPGFAGQSFIPSALEKIAAVRAMIDASGRNIRLEVDGGIKIDTIAKAAQHGADTFVAGSAIFHSKDYADTIQQLRNKISPFT